LLTLQEQIKTNQDYFLAEIKEMQQKVEAAFHSRDTKMEGQIEGMKKEILNVTRQNAELQREV
jgi:hypothetical protein